MCPWGEKGTNASKNRQTKRQRGREEKEDFTILANLQYRKKFLRGNIDILFEYTRNCI